MRINCFRPARSPSLDDDLAPRPVQKRSLNRKASAQSASSSRRSTASNLSISKLPPCPGVSDPRIEAMMMPSPPEVRPSRCLRLSQPKTYSNIVDSMKASRGCRNWRSFDVFDDQTEIDAGVSAIDIARRRARDCEEKCRLYGSDDSDAASVDEVDMIG